MSYHISHITKNSAAIVTKTDAPQVIAPLGTAQVHFNNELIDRLGEFDIATWNFTARKTGIYLIGAQLSYSILNVAARMDILLLINGALGHHLGVYDFTGVGMRFATFSVLRIVNQNEVINVHINNVGVGNITIENAPLTQFWCRRQS